MTPLGVKAVLQPSLLCKGAHIQSSPGLLPFSRRNSQTFTLKEESQRCGMRVQESSNSQFPGFNGGGRMPLCISQSSLIYSAAPRLCRPHHSWRKYTHIYFLNFFKRFYLFRLPKRVSSHVGRETGRERGGSRLPAEQRVRCGAQCGA